jgi:lipopolysaccharide/colanic/teichoic acid biosynthesis glycosyltransferase
MSLATIETGTVESWLPPAASDRHGFVLERWTSEQTADLGQERSSRRGAAAAKRAMDVVVASMLLVATLPVLLVAMAAIRLTSPGPVVFAQWRCGKDGVPFRCYKLRTMVDGAERLLQADFALHADFLETWKLPRDPRVTAVGGFLRRTSIDELPQLINVLRGEMSMVGPRPVQLPEAYHLYGTQVAAVLRHKPGLTGMWQVSGRSSTPYHERAELDLRYVASQSFWLDVTLLVQTIPAVLSMRDAV